MTNTDNHNLSRQKIQQILASVGIESEEDTKHNIDAFDYNWNQPRCFNSDQLEELDTFTEKLAQTCAEKYTQLFNSEFNVTITSTTQHFASEITNPENVKNDYYLKFGTENQTFGMVGIPSLTAINWTTQLLGDADSAENEDRELSQLEQSLLLDIATAIIETLSDSYDNYDLHPTSEIVREQLPVELEGTEELCKISFSVKKPDSENASDAYFLMFCDKLEPVVGQSVQTGEDSSAKDVAKAILQHVHKLPVAVTAQLASIALTFEEIMSLQVDDILLLDKRVNEPAELIVEGQTILRGRLAKSDGNYAMVITELTAAK
jgi:flagellar motor switch protein FliM